jgi:PadR family transcriptional regulator
MAKVNENRKKGMRVGAVSLWLLLLLSEKPMYGYELIKELEKRFSGHWRPKTGTIYPALDKLEQEKLVTSQREFREEGPDRKHYALTEKGKGELSSSMSHWVKMMEILEKYREMHEAIYRYKTNDANRNELSKLLINLGNGLKNNEGIEVSSIFPSKEGIVILPSEPISFKFLYAKEDHKLEMHMELEWVPSSSSSPASSSESKQ